MTFLGAAANVNTNASEQLPPPPQSGQPEKPTTFADQGVKLEPNIWEDLSKLARERDEQRRLGNATMDQWRDLLDRA